MYVFGNESSNEAIVKSFILTGLPDSTSRIARFFSFYLKIVQKRLFGSVPGGDSPRIVVIGLFSILLIEIFSKLLGIPKI